MDPRQAQRAAAALSGRIAADARRTTIASTCIPKPRSPAQWRYVRRHAGCRAQPRGDRRPMSPSAATSTSPALYSMSSAAKMTSFVPTSDVPVQLLRRPALARRARLGRTAARRQSGGGVCDVRYDDRAKSPIAACPMMSSAAADRIRANGLPHWLADRLADREVRRWPNLRSQPGASTRRLYGRRMRPSRRHGDAVDRDPSRHHGAAADENPAGLRGRGSGGDRLFRDGADDPAAAGRPACAGLFRHRRFRPAGLCRDRAHPGQDALQPARRAAAPL